MHRLYVIAAALIAAFLINQLPLFTTFVVCLAIGYYGPRLLRHKRLSHSATKLLSYKELNR